MAPFCLKSESRFEKQKQLDPITPEQAARLISIQCAKEMISDSAELCKTEICFSHIQLMENKCMTSKKCTMLLQKWISNQSLETFPVCTVLQCFPHENIFCIHMCNGCQNIKRLTLLSQAVVHFVIGRASLFTDHKISGRPILPSISISEQFESMYLTILQQILFLLL